MQKALGFVSKTAAARAAYPTPSHGTSAHLTTFDVDM
jgi:hypothetical protein